MTRNDEQRTGDGPRAAVGPDPADDSRDSDTNGATNREQGLPARLRDRLSSRRAFLSDSAILGGGALALASAGGAAATTAEHDDGDGGEVDQPEGFSLEPVAPHATFPDDVAAAFGVTFENGTEESAFVRDASTLLVARADFEPGGTTGWHVHPGPVIVSVVEGAIEVVFEDECTTHTYAAGEAWLDAGGHAEIANNASESESAMAYAVFFGVPDGEPPTTWVEPADC